MNAQEHLERLFHASIEAKQATLKQGAATIIAAAEVMAGCLAAGGKLLLCGNGGSAADAQHLAAEMLVRLRTDVRRRALPAIALAMDPSSLTASGNDHGFESHFERMVQALGQPGDVLIALTTSGKSPNVVRALAAARALRLHTVGLLGGHAQPAREHCDLAIVVPSHDTGRIQECHITIGHALMELVEEMMIERGQLAVE